MNLARRFAELRSGGRRALMPFLTAGYPDRDLFHELVAEAARSGADVIEIGVPFSDPLADGPAIQYSSARALANGVTLRRILDELGELPQTVPLVLMTYVNPVLGLGWTAFARAAREARVSGVIVPDLPVEEGRDLEDELRSEGVDLVYLAAPTTGEARLRELGRRSRGFLYLVSVTGVTGSRDRLPGDLPPFVQRARAATDLPLCLGFGISGRELARDAARLVDGVIVGSAIVERIRASGEDGSSVGAVSSLLREIREGMDSA